MAAKKTSKKTKKLQLSKTDKVFTGLIGGIADYFEISSTFLRIIMIILVAMSGFFPMIIGYFVVAFLVSQQS